MFIFKFINANIAVIFTIYNERNLAKLNQLLIGQIIVKIGTAFNTLALTPYVIMRAKKGLYFAKCKAHSIRQAWTTNKYFQEPMYSKDQIEERNKKEQ